MESRKDIDNKFIKSCLDILHGWESNAEGMELTLIRINLAYFYLLQLQLLVQEEKDDDVIRGLFEIILHYLPNISDNNEIISLSENIYVSTYDTVKFFEKKQRQEKNEVEFIKNTNARRVHYFFDRSQTQDQNTNERVFSSLAHRITK